MAGETRRAVDALLNTVRVAKVTTLADQVDESIVLERVVATLSGLFGALGASLAAIGLYGLLACTVARRTSEIGVRMALGATERDVTWMVLKSALALVVAGRPGTTRSSLPPRPSIPGTSTSFRPTSRSRISMPRRPSPTGRPI